MAHSRRWPALAVLVSLSVATAPHALVAQALKKPVATAVAAAKRPITHDVYDGWRSIQTPKLSDDGAWLAYVLQPQDGDGELVVRNLRTGVERRAARGKDPQFTPDAAFVAFTVAPVKADVDKAEKAKKKPEEQPKGGFGVIDLATGQAWTTERVKSFRLPKRSSTAVAFLREVPEKKADEKKDEEKAGGEKEKGAEGRKKEKKKDPGTDLVVRTLASGAEHVIADATDYQWTPDGAWLVYTTSSKAPERDGAWARRTSDGEVRPLATGLGHYKSVVIDDGGKRAAFVTDRDDYASDAPAFSLFGWQVGDSSASRLVDAATAGMPAGFTVSEHGKLEFSKDGERLFLGTAALPTPEPEDAPEPVKVDLWHWKDPLIQPMQKVRADEEKKRSYRAVVHVGVKRFVQLATPSMPQVVLTPDGDAAFATSNVPYQQLISWDSDYEDAYALDLSTGAARRVVERGRFDAAISPGGRWLAYYDVRTPGWMAIDLGNAAAAPVSLTASLGVRFVDETWDTPSEPQPYGLAGWTENDRSVLLYDRYDIWEVTPDGSAAPRMVTAGAGRKAQRVYRYVSLDPEKHAIDPRQPLLLSVTDEGTRASGFARASLTGPVADAPRVLTMLEKSTGGVVKAKHADAIVFTQQRFDEFPDLWATDLAFATPRKVTDANPQQREYLWGNSEQITYVNADGKRLKALLTKPENFDAAKKYPLLVYIYEELSQGLHRYVPPSPGTSINVTRYVSNGYVVLQPDIVYDTGYPGESAYKCVLPAVQRVLDMGFVDPARVGIQGHSWGGYQITYLVTRTNIFRAVEAGASVSNMVSAYGGIRWGTGMSRAFQYEKTQSRIGGPPWQQPLQFIENSPIFWVDKINTPYLTVHNDEDDAVPWYQAIEFYSAMRRLGKEIYFFNYNGEKHGLRERENQEHWTVHMAEFFDHYLLGAPRPAWMDAPTPYLERGKRDITTFYKKPGEAPAPKAAEPAATSGTGKAAGQQKLRGTRAQPETVPIADSR